MDDTGHISHDEQQQATSLPLAARAFWQTLAADGLPSLKAVSHDGLSPFREDSLLIEYTDGGPVIRHVGARLGAAMGLGAAQKGSLLLGHSPLADAMSSLFLVVKQSGVATEDVNFFGFDGVALPFKGPHGDLAFALGVFAPSDPEGASQLMHAAVEDGRAMITSGIANARTREGLYGILACAMDIRHASLQDMGAFQEMLRENGLSAQARAPFTPIIKLLLGRGYDKTRVAEYSTALQFAERHGLKGASLRSFFQGLPGGIKGCVRMERSIRKVSRGEAADPALAAALKWLEGQPAKGQASVPSDEDYVFLLAKKGHDEGIYDVIRKVDMATNDKRRYLKKAANEPDT